MRFSEYFGLKRSQFELDFVDIPIETDISLFLDPYVFSIMPDPWFEECDEILVAYFGLVLTAIKSGDEKSASDLLGRLHEPNQTHLGLSQKNPAGRAIGQQQAGQLLERLKGSQAVVTGFLKDLADCELLIPGIGRDKISDITTNILKVPLMEYTNRQCRDLNIPVMNVAQSYWNPVEAKWANSYVPLPVVNSTVGQEAIILVPKIAARLDLSFDARDYYRNHVLVYLQAEHREAGSSLVHVLKNGNRKVYKKDLEDAYPFSKEFLYSFSKEQPEVLEKYKNVVVPSVPLKNEDIETIQVEPQEFHYEDLCSQLKLIPPGNDSAGDYHTLIMGIIEALFYPQLWKFTKEQEINEGRKRVDIVSNNCSTTGFFHQINAFHRILCPYIFFECKNYSNDPGNPEVDQLNGRFSAQRGRFGILVCRKIEDRDRLTARCRDLLHDAGSYPRLRRR